jgi:hypothetical protein
MPLPMKTCVKCEIERFPEEFHMSRRSKDGMTSYCKPCQTKYQREYLAKKKQAQKVANV